MDRNAFLDASNRLLFAGELRPAQCGGIHAILDGWEQWYPDGLAGGLTSDALSVFRVAACAWGDSVYGLRLSVGRIPYASFPNRPRWARVPCESWHPSGASFSRVVLRERFGSSSCAEFSDRPIGNSWVHNCHRCRCGRGSTPEDIRRDPQGSSRTNVASGRRPICHARHIAAQNRHWGWCSVGPHSSRCGKCGFVHYVWSAHASRRSAAGIHSWSFPHFLGYIHGHHAQFRSRNDKSIPEWPAAMRRDARPSMLQTDDHSNQ